MATTKSFTSLEQSRKLADILPLESADMCFKCLDEDPYDIVCRPYSEWKDEYKGLLISRDADVIPCWSLAALLVTLNFPSLIQNKEDKWEICVIDDKKDEYIEMTASNPIDACVEMIIKLHKQKLL